MLRRTPLRSRSTLHRRTGLTSRTPLAATGRLARIVKLDPGTGPKWRSPKREAQMALYRPLAAAYLAEHEWCQFPGCNARSTEVHHRRGRFGDRLLDTRWFAASCHVHNELAETRTGEARACGWLIDIEGAA